MLAVALWLIVVILLGMAVGLDHLLKRMESTLESIEGKLDDILDESDDVRESN